MYRSYFRLRENPFALTPDPRFLFLSHRHKEALAHLLYGMGERGGFVLLTGEVGTGKTTLCRSTLEQAPHGVDVALILNPKQTAGELVASVCDELQISYPQGTVSIKVLVDLLNRHLLATHAEGRRTVLIIDEAQNLSTEVLEQIRLLTNLETTTQKLLQILLIGQPELQALMARPELRQLSQRVTARYHLKPLFLEDTKAYIQHRLEVGGCDRRLFTKGALRLVHKLSGGVPRLINIICDRALLGAYAKQQEIVNRRLVLRAGAEVLGKKEPVRYRWIAGWTATVVVIALLVAVWWLVPLPITQQWMGTTDKSGDQPVMATVAEPKGAPKFVKPVPGAKDRQSAQDYNGHVALADLLRSERVRTDINTAFTTLLRYWHLDHPDKTGITGCERAGFAGLSCLYGKGNWTTLRHYNRPALLDLIDSSKNRHYVTIVALQDGQASLDLGDQLMSLPLSEVESLWFGSYTLLWKPPFSPPLLQLGSTGPDVLWLRAQLDRLNVEPRESEATPPSLFFDDALRKRVMKFQRSCALEADGVVGDKTLFELSRAIQDPSAPTLTGPEIRNQGEKDVIHP